MSFPRYPKYKDSGVEWLGEVPAHWAVAPIKAVATCNDDVLEEKTPDDFEIDYVEISDVDAVAGITGRTTIPFGSAPSRARRRVSDGDVLVSTVRTYLRAIAQVKGDPGNMIASTGFAVIRPRKVHSGYLGYACCAEYLISEVIARSVGVSYPAINASDLMRLQIPVPTMDEQRTVAEFLDAELLKIDGLVGEQEKLIALLKEKRQAVISHAVTKGLDPNVPMKDSGIEWLGEVPAHWLVARIGALFREVIEEGNDDLPILSVSIHHGVSDKELQDEELDRKVSRSDDRSKYRRVSPGDLVYNMMRAWQGGFGSVVIAGAVSPAYVVARPIRTLVTAFIEGQLRTACAVEEMRRHSKGVTDFRLRLYWDEFKTMVLAVPPLGEQQAIMDVVNEQVARFDGLVFEAESGIVLLNERRQALISAVVTGKIDVRKPI